MRGVFSQKTVQFVIIHDVCHIYRYYLMLSYYQMKQEEKDLANFFSRFPKISYSKKEIVLNAYDAYENLYFIEKGVVRSFFIDDNGIEFTVNFLKPYSIFPLSAFLSDRENNSEFEAFVAMDLRKAAKDKVADFIEKNPEIQSFFLKRMSTGLEGYVVRSQFLIRGSAEQKVVSSLLLLGLRFGRKVKNYTHIDLPLTHQDVADLSGITRETATLCINELEDNKLIAKKGKYFKLFNEKKLNEICKTFEDGSYLDFNF